MSGIVQSNTVRTSGVIAASSAGLDWSSPVITGSTLSASANAGYWINTTANTCTITLPSPAEVGDQIVFADYARTWGTYKIIIDSNGLNYQGQDDTFIVEYDTSGETVSIVYSGATKGWIPMDDDEVADVPVNTAPTQKGIIAFGEISGAPYYTNNRILINSSGVLASSTSGVGTIKGGIAGAGYGYDKGICSGGSGASTTNLVSNTGVVAADVTGVGTARNRMCGTTFGGDKGFFGFGSSGSNTNITNLVSNVGVVASDVSGTGTARVAPGAATYGSTGQALAAFGGTGSGGYLNVRNLITNQGVMASDISGAGTTQDKHLATRYGTDTSIFVYGQNGTNSDLSTSNKVSNTGVIAADVTGVGTGAYGKVASSFGGDKGIFYGGRNETTATFLTESNIVSNTGVVASSVANSGNTSVLGAAGMGYSQTA